MLSPAQFSLPSASLILIYWHCSLIRWKMSLVSTWLHDTCTIMLQQRHITQQNRISHTAVGYHENYLSLSFSLYLSHTHANTLHIISAYVLIALSHSLSLCWYTIQVSLFLSLPSLSPLSLSLSLSLYPSTSLPSFSLSLHTYSFPTSPWRNTMLFLSADTRWLLLSRSSRVSENCHEEWICKKIHLQPVTLLVD